MKDYKLYLIVIRECLEKINAYVVNGKDDFMNSQMTQDAVFLNLEIIGKSIKNLPQEWKDSEPDIEWLTFVNLSDILTYDYFQINLENYPNGIYTLNLQVDKFKTSSRIVIHR